MLKTKGSPDEDGQISILYLVNITTRVFRKRTYLKTIHVDNISLIPCIYTILLKSKAMIRVYINIYVQPFYWIEQLGRFIAN